MGFPVREREGTAGVCGGRKRAGGSEAGLRGVSRDWYWYYASRTNASFEFSRLRQDGRGPLSRCLKPPTHRPNDRPTYCTYLPTNRPTYLPTYRPTYLPIYLSTDRDLPTRTRQLQNILLARVPSASYNYSVCTEIKQQSKKCRVQPHPSVSAHHTYAIRLVLHTTPYIDGIPRHHKKKSITPRTYSRHTKDHNPPTYNQLRYYRITQHAITLGDKITHPLGRI